IPEIRYPKIRPPPFCESSVITPRSAVAAPHGSSPSGGFYVRLLEPHRPEHLRSRPAQNADQRGEPEHPAIERSRRAEPGDEDEQHQNLEYVGRHGGDHQRLRALASGPADGEDADPEEHRDQRDPEYRPEQAFPAADGNTDG